MSTYREHINTLTQRYNEAIQALEDSYNYESSQSHAWNLTSSHLKKQYSKKYEVLAREYRQKRRQVQTSYEQTHPEWAKWRRWWGRIFVIGIVLAMVCCGAAMPVDDTPAVSDSSIDNTSSAVTSSTGDTYWNADNIPIPFLKDSTQYVSNPDQVLTQQSVDRMNVTLKRLDNELHIQSVVIIVNHIENDDPYRMAQDVGNKYGVGYGDRGLIVVVGYQDHSVNISPGKSLEADLTDVECHRLEQRYVVPAMRAEMPDSAMIYLTEGIYALMQKKEMPNMSSLMDDDDEFDAEIATVLGLTFLGLIAWCVFFLRLNRKYEWLATVGAVSLLANPFYEAPRTYSGGGGFGGFGGGSGGGGGFSGGSFGGGSFGGGGATSRW